MAAAVFRFSLISCQSLPGVSSYEEKGIDAPGERVGTFRWALYAPANTPQLRAQSPTATTTRGSGTASNVRRSGSVMLPKGSTPRVRWSGDRPT